MAEDESVHDELAAAKRHLTLAVGHVAAAVEGVCLDGRTSPVSAEILIDTQKDLHEKIGVLGVVGDHVRAYQEREQSDAD